MAMHPGTTDVLGSAHMEAPSVSVAEETSKKVRKPYTITKSRESWTDQEHDKFLEALQLFDRDWKKIEAFVGSKTVIQIRSHAQKYFLKVQKNGTGEHVPPPRPKRKSAQPYPQKAAKTVPVPQPVSRGSTSRSQAEPTYAARVQPSAAYSPPVSSSAAMPAWVHHMGPPGTGFMTKGGISTAGLGSNSVSLAKDQLDSNGGSSPSRFQQQLVSAPQGNGETYLRAMPDFAEVYGFIGSVFDPTMDGHLNRMREMAPIDKETVLLLMRSLTINLSSPDFEEHKLFMSVYDMNPENTMLGAGTDVKEQTGAIIAASQPHLDAGDGIPFSGQPEPPEARQNTEAVCESEAQESKSLIKFYHESATEHPQQCHPYDGGGEERNHTADVQNTFGSGHLLQLEETPSLILDQCTVRTPGFVKISSAAEGHSSGKQNGSFEAVAGEDDVETEGVDFWWS